MTTKIHKGPSNAAEAAHMRMRKQQNIQQSLNSRAEAWAFAALQDTAYKWTRQATWGWRVFDFWNSKLGIAIEIDGPEHSAVKDLRRDAKNWKVSRIRVIRVRNFNQQDLNRALEEIEGSETWNE